MELKGQLEVISQNGNPNKIAISTFETIEIDKKYDFKAYNPIPEMSNCFEITIYLVLSHKKTSEELFHFIGNLKLIIKPTGETQKNDMIFLSEKLEQMYKDYWIKLSNMYGIPTGLLIQPYFDLNVIDKIFEYLNKWGYY